MDDVRLVALGFFKDWSNYLLVTSVAALGWVSTKPLGITNWVHTASVVCLAVAIAFGIFTLAMIPLVAQQMKYEAAFYDVRVRTSPLLVGELRFRIKAVCWPQHVAFIAGIVLYAYGVVMAEPTVIEPSGGST